MDHGLSTMLGIGLALICAGAFAFTRRVQSEGGVYARRIVGTMLTAFGGILIMFSIGLTLAGVGAGAGADGGASAEEAR